MIKRSVETFLKNAVYKGKFKDNLFVIKAGGQVVADAEALENLLTDIKDLTMNGVRVLLIYGGGTPIDIAMKEAGIEPKKHNGRRITTEDDMRIVKRVLGGDLAYRMYEAMAKTGVDGLCLNAVPSDWLDVEFRPKEPVDFGFVGDIKRANKRNVMRAFGGASFIASPCVAATSDGAAVNINADTVASELAIGCEAHKLIFLSDVDGVLVDGKTMSTITDKQIPQLVESGVAAGGMRVKLENCLHALQSGVRRIHIINGFRKKALLDEIYTPAGSGTMILREDEKSRYDNEVAYQKTHNV